jgi:Flp pilus assembly pilin Flp
MLPNFSKMAHHLLNKSQQEVVSLPSGGVQDLLTLIPLEESMLKKLIRGEKGQDMVEYALLASFISIVAIAALRLIGPLVNAIYVAIQAALT